jgi:hypothetical protein
MKSQFYSIYLDSNRGCIEAILIGNTYLLQLVIIL